MCVNKVELKVRLYHDLREDNPLLDELCLISKAQ